ncbi:hypothetical protein [Streptomyces sp. NPDC001719]
MAMSGLRQTVSFLERGIERELADDPLLTVDMAGEPVRLTLEAARRALYEGARDSQVAESIWLQVLRAAQKDEATGGRWHLFALGLALPRMRGAVRFAVDRLRVDWPDAESEAATGFLEALADTAGGELAEPDALMTAACRRLWRFGNRTAREVPVVDIAAVAAARTAGLPAEDELPSEDGWALEVTPPDRDDGLSAPIHFTLSPATVELVRLDALADRMGLKDVVYRARRPGEGTPIGILSLRPAGAPR